MKTIDFCIPFIGSGLRYAEFLISNLLATAAHPERISILLSAHSPSDAELIKNSTFHSVVKRIVMAHAYTPGDNRFAVESVIGSVNHCSAIQSLFDQATADVVIFSDYDMAFLDVGWDQKIIEILDDHDLCGVEYPSYAVPITLVDVTEMHLFGCKYQKTPNLRFLAISQKCLKTFFSQGISSFHHFLVDGGLPLQIVHTVEMADALHLPEGTMWWMDSGCEIPFVILNNALRYQTFSPTAFDKQTVFSSTVFTQSPASDYLPEVFVESISGEPFLAHYGHGTIKSLQPDNNVSFDCFVSAVNEYLARRK
jgi:hypothetical protein